MSTLSEPSTHAALREPPPLPVDLVSLGAVYDADYYERGVESGKSCYSNYRWLPELTIPMAMVLIDTLGIRPDQRVLDFGCAKGFVTKALRMLRRDAWGIDISRYALSQAPEDIKPYVSLQLDLDAFARGRGGASTASRMPWRRTCSSTFPTRPSTVRSRTSRA